MTRLALVEKTKINLQEVTVLLSGKSRIEVEVLMQMFVGFGARHIRRAETLDETQRMIEEDQIDLVIIDVAHGLDETLTVVRQLRRATDDTRYAPIVLSTAHTTPTLLEQARNAGVSYIVTKPLAPRVLFERLIWMVKDARPFIDADGYVGPCRRARLLGPPPGMAGRRQGDLSPELGDASTPNLSQNDIDSLFPIRKAG